MVLAKFLSQLYSEGANW